MKISQKSGVTLTELIVVMVVIGILSGIAVPLYTNMTENSRNNEATTALAVIYMGEKVYASGNGGNFWPNPAGTETSISLINTNLNVDIAPLSFFSLSLVTTNDVNGNPTIFSVGATRTASSGGDTNKVFTVTPASPKAVCTDAGGGHACDGYH